MADGSLDRVGRPAARSETGLASEHEKNILPKIDVRPLGFFSPKFWRIASAGLCAAVTLPAEALLSRGSNTTDAAEAVSPVAVWYGDGKARAPMQERLESWMWQAVAHGAREIAIYAWYPMTSGFESNAYGPIARTGSRECGSNHRETRSRAARCEARAGTDRHSL